MNAKERDKKCSGSEAMNNCSGHCSGIAVAVAVFVAVAVAVAIQLIQPRLRWLRDCFPRQQQPVLPLPTLPHQFLPINARFPAAPAPRPPHPSLNFRNLSFPMPRQPHSPKNMLLLMDASDRAPNAELTTLMTICGSAVQFMY